MKSFVFAVLCLVSSVAFAGEDTTGRNGFIYRGTEFTKIFTAQSGTPFLNPEGAVKGWVQYYGSRYDNVMLQYDIEDDQLISNDLSGKIRMQLVKEKISAFGFSGRSFIAIPGSTQFYETVYPGASNVLIRWQKIYTRMGTEEGKYRLYKMIYIYREGATTIIENKQDLFSYFGKNNKQIREYFRDQGLSMKKDAAKAVATVVAYADKNGYYGR